VRDRAHGGPPVRRRTFRSVRRTATPSFLLALILLAGCGSDPAPPSDPAEPTEVATEAPTQVAPPDGTPVPPPPGSDGSSPAINSISVDPADGTIMVGTGPALFRIDPGSKQGERIAGTVTTDKGSGTVSGNLVLRFTGPGDLLASGHPQEGALPENLPLIRSSDHGATWQAVPGTAEGDYHELESSGDTIIAVSVDAPDVLISRDGGKSFETKTPPAAPIDVVVNPKDPQQMAVSTEQGTFSSSNGGDSWRPRDTTFGARLTWPDDLYSVDRSGKVRASRDGGSSWEDRGDVGGLPSVIASGRKDELLVGIIGGKVQRSRDGGRKWATAATLR
jgi:photosystem II stability/assembly factor-like uncharacterized protein